MKHNRQAGFTIVEMLIATAVFAVVLLVMSAAIIQIGRFYYKGITSAHTQEVARSIMENMAQTVQFTSGQITTDGLEAPTDFQTKAICVGTYHYSYKLGQQRTGNLHSLVMYDNHNSCAGRVAQTLNTAVLGQELLGDKMRLSKFTVTQVPGSTSTYKVTVGVLYGDSGLVCVAGSTSGLADDCNATGEMTDTQVTSAADNGTNTLRCKNVRSGSEFCAVSELSTIVERRVQ